MYCWQVWDLMTVLRCWWPIYYMETSLTKRCHQHHCQQTIHRSLRTKMPENIFKIPEDFGHVPKYQTVAFTRAKSQKIFHWDLLLNRTRWFRWIFQILKIMKFPKIFSYVDITGIFWHFRARFLTFWYSQNKKTRISKQFSDISVCDLFETPSMLYCCWLGNRPYVGNCFRQT